MANKVEAKTKKARDAAFSRARTKTKKVRPQVVAAKPRKLKPALSRRDHFIRPKDVRFTKLPNVIKLSKVTASVIWQRKRVFLGIALIDGLLNLILVQGVVSSLNVATLENDLSHAGHGHSSAFATSVNAFGQLLGSGGGPSSSTGAYTVILAVITSLAVIWGLRQIYSAKKVTVREAYYRSTYPLIPFILVLIVLIIELIPVIVGASIYSLVINDGIAVGLVEKIIWLIVFILSAGLSFYLACSTLFALYVVTLPDMTPLKAMRSARNLVRYRRLVLLRKLIWLPFVLLLVAVIIMLPVILWITAWSQWVFFVLSIAALIVANSYIYNLYRELLNE